MNEITAKLVAEALAKTLNDLATDGNAVSIEQDGAELGWVDEANTDVKVSMVGSRATFRILTSEGQTFEIRVDEV